MAKKAKSKTSLDERVDLRITSKEKTLFEEAARAQGQTLSKWLRFAALQIIHDHKGVVRFRPLD